MHGEGFFYQAFVYLSAAVVAVPVARRLGLGSVLGYLMAGMLIGPFGLGLIGEEGRDVMHFAEFGVVILLFLVGLELQPSLLWDMRRPILGMGGLQVGLSTAAFAGIGVLLGLAWQPALAVGMALSLSSTAIALQTLTEKRLLNTDGGQRSFAVLLFQDLAVIPMLAVFPLLASGGAGTNPAAAQEHGASWVEGLPGWAETLVVLAAVGFVVLAGRFLVPRVFRAIARVRLREIFTAAALLLVIGTALLMSKVGLSPALGTFLAGVLLANSEYRHELEIDIEPFKGLLLGVFFLAVGASVDFGLITARPGLTASLVGLLLAVKIAVLFALGRLCRMGLDQNLLFSFGLAQGGEFGFVLFSFASQRGVIPGEVANPLVAVVAISMAVTPLLLFVNEKILQPRFGTREKVEREADPIHGENPVIIAGFGRFGSVVGRFLRANGVETTVLEYDSDRVEVLRRLGLKTFYGDASRYDLLQAAGADRARLIVLAIDDHEKIMGMVETVRKHFPHLQILARAAGRIQTYDLMEAGVAHTYREVFDSALRTGVDALVLLGGRAYHAHRMARTFHRHEEESVRALSGMRHDTGAYYTLARQRIEDLERILLSEVRDPGTCRDAGWDVDSRREQATCPQEKE